MVTLTLVRGYFCQVIALENFSKALNTTLHCRPADLAAWLARVLPAETAPLAARRGGRLWRLEHERLALPAADPARTLRRNGVFVVAGHLASGLGRVWAEGLAARPDLRLALVEAPDAAPLDCVPVVRSPSPPRGHSDAPRRSDGSPDRDRHN